MSKKRVMLLVLVILLVLTGCNSITNKKSSQDGTGILVDDVYKGTQGVYMNFITDRPPSRIYDKQNAFLTVELLNKGAYETDGKLFLTGYDPNIVRGVDNSKEFGPLEGKTKYNLNGGFNRIDFESRSIDIPEGTDSYKPRFLVSMCYQYKTLANAQVCVDPKLYDINVEQKSCQVRDVSMGGGQGGPVAVSAVRVDTIQNKAIFKIEIVNSGKGKVARYEECPFELEWEDLDTVQYRVTLSGQAPEKPCSPQDKVRLDSSGRATVFCTFRVPEEKTLSYQTLLRVELDYGYMDSIYKDVEIIKSPT